MPIHLLPAILSLPITDVEMSARWSHEAGSSQPLDVVDNRPWLLRGPQVTLRVDMDMGLTGVGAVCEDGFWHIFPADYEPSFN